MFDDIFSKTGLSLDRLRVLCEVADAGGIARAAPNDSTRQSQFSRQLKELEDFFEVELTRRQGKGITLTRAGEELALRSRELLQGLQDFRLQWINKPLRYSIGAGESLLEWLVLPNLAKSVEDGPPASFRLQNLRTNQIVAGLQDLSIDFGLIRQDALRPPLEAYSLGNLEYALYCPEQIQAKRAVKADLLHVLQNIPLALLDSDGDFMRNFKAWIEKSQISLSVKLVCDSLPKTFCAFKTGRYAAILPTIAVRELPENSFVKFTLPLEMGARSVYLAWNPRTLRLRDQAPKVAEFLKKALQL